MSGLDVLGSRPLLATFAESEGMASSSEINRSTRRLVRRQWMAPNPRATKAAQKRPSAWVFLVGDGQENYDTGKNDVGENFRNLGINRR